MRPLLLVLLAVLLAVPAHAVAQETGPSGPTGPVNPVPPTATTGSATDIGLNAATARGTVGTGGGETRVQFQYGTTTSYGLITPVQTLPAGATAADVQARLERLTPSTTYHVRVVATNDAGVTRGADRTFRTASPPSRPGVASEPARDITLDAATLQARVDPNKQATTYLFEYGTTTRYGTRTPAADAGAGDTGIRVQARISLLKPNTTYHFRLRATNASGTTTGSRRSFRTGKVPLALRASVTPTTVRYTGALTISGTVSGSDNRGVPVFLERRTFPYDTDFRRDATQQTTDAAGVVRFVLPPFSLASQFRLVSPAAGGLVSNVSTVRVRALVRLRARRVDGGRVRFSGTVAPGTARGTASLQRQRADGRWVRVRRATLRRGRGVARVTVTVRAPRRATRYRLATTLSTGGLTDARSPSVRLSVRR